MVLSGHTRIELGNGSKQCDNILGHQRHTELQSYAEAYL